MPYMVDFKIETTSNRQVQPIYVLGDDKPVMISRGPTYCKTVVSFADGTIIIKDHGFFIINELHFASLDEAFEILSENIIETILFNIDIFRSL